MFLVPYASIYILQVLLTKWLTTVQSGSKSVDIFKTKKYQDTVELLLTVTAGTGTVTNNRIDG